MKPRRLKPSVWPKKLWQTKALPWNTPRPSPSWRRLWLRLLRFRSCASALTDPAAFAPAMQKKAAFGLPFSLAFQKSRFGKIWRDLARSEFANPEPRCALALGAFAAFPPAQPF